MLSASLTCATAAGHWFITSLREHGDALLDEVPDILGTIFIRMLKVQERSVRGFLLEVVSVLAGFHIEAMTSSLLRKPLPMDSDTSELWRALGGDDFLTLHILRLLMSKIQHLAGKDRSSAEDSAPLGLVAATCGSLEMCTSIHSSPMLRELLPEILSALLEQAGSICQCPQVASGGGSCSRGSCEQCATLAGRENWLPNTFHSTFGLGELPCNPSGFRLSMETLTCVISKGLGEGVAAALCEEGAWLLLESPQTHHEGVCQLARLSLCLHDLPVSKPTSHPMSNRRAPLAEALPHGVLWDSALLVCDPIIEEHKLLKPVLHLLQQRARDSNNLVQQMTATELDDIVYGDPDQCPGRLHKEKTASLLYDPIEAELDNNPVSPGGPQPTGGQGVQSKLGPLLPLPGLKEDAGSSDLPCPGVRMCETRAAAERPLLVLGGPRYGHLDHRGHF
ncbi:hypothetical protein Y1Q_0005208 [Alligator mississippiensis]|uniref:Maestro-like HEAT-repeats domain-containing protein n=1 Tax=Alligator mississippiensis TaxID=8496 RepID=A0A151MT09_ALLMI|nr:hypothetical protein Y1Q_0005208 [Alligator mississippiensis]